MRRSSDLPIRNGEESQSSSRITSNSLPGFNHIMAPLNTPCPRCHRTEPAGCQHQCSTTSDDSTFSSTMEPTYTMSHTGSMSSISNVPSARSGPSTPMSSRSPSVSGSAEGGYTSSVDTPEEWLCVKCGFACSISDHVKGEKKKGKEKNARADQAEVLQNAEDMFLCMFNWKPSKTQSSGNGNAAGVETPKIDLLRILLFLTNKYLEPQFIQAMAEDREEPWKMSIQRELAAYLARFHPTADFPNGKPYDPSFDGTLMELQDKRPCRSRARNDAGSKRCTTHTEGLNHVECRKRRRVAAFMDRKAAAKQRIRRG